MKCVELEIGLLPKRMLSYIPIEVVGHKLR